MASPIHPNLGSGEDEGGSADEDGYEPRADRTRTGKRLVDIKHSFTLACEDVQIYNFRFHDLRHTAATRLADTGADAFTIAEILGHASLVMTKRYTHATDEAKRKAVERVAERMAETANNGTAGKDCLKFVTNEKRQALEPAVNS